jgi:hypothetical protein
MNSRTSNLYIGNPNPNANDQALAVDDTVGGVQFATLHIDTDYVVIDIQDNNVLVTFDGSAPTVSNGHLLVKEQGLIVLSKNAAKGAKFLGSGGTSIIQSTEFVD